MVEELRSGLLDIVELTLSPMNREDVFAYVYHRERDKDGDWYPPGSRRSTTSSVMTAIRIDLPF
jgi:hypothetical protein